MTKRSMLAAVFMATCLAPLIGWAQDGQNVLRIRTRPASPASPKVPAARTTPRMGPRLRLVPRKPAPKPPPRVETSPSAAPNRGARPAAPKPLPEPGPVRRADGPKFYDFQKIRERHRQRPRIVGFDAIPVTTPDASERMIFPGPQTGTTRLPPTNPLPMTSDDTEDSSDDTEDSSYGTEDSSYSSGRAYADTNQFVPMVSSPVARSLMAPQQGYRGQGIGGIPTFTLRPCPKHWYDPWTGYCAERVQEKCGHCLPWCSDFGRLGSPGSVYMYEHHQTWIGESMAEDTSGYPEGDAYPSPTPPPPPGPRPPRNELPMPGGR